MLFHNAAAINDKAGGTSYSHSRLFIFTPDSRYVKIRLRNHLIASWENDYECSINLPYPFTGDSETRVWVLSDTHLGIGTSPDYAETVFSDAMADIESAGDPDYVLVLGDLTEDGTVAQFDTYKTIRSESALSSDYWYEACGNHDCYTNDTNFLTELGYSSFYYYLDIANVRILVIGQRNSSEMLESERNWLTGQLQDNKDTRNLLVATHYPVPNTTTGTTDSGLTPIADITSIHEDNRIESWLFGHYHYDVTDKDNFVYYDSFDIYDSLSIEEENSIKEELLEESLGIEEQIRLNHFSCGTVKQSKFGEFKYAQDTYGMGVRVNECVSIDESLLRKFNDAWLRNLSDSISFSESLTRTAEYHLELEDSLSFSESLIDTHEIKRTLEDSMPVAENIANATTLRISDSITVDLTLQEMSIEEGRVLSTGWKFYIRDSSGNRVASLTNARDRWFKEALNHGGSAGFKLDATDDNCNSTILAINSNELIIEYKGYTMFGGQISTITKVAEGNDIYWEVIAKQFFNLLEQRYCGYNKSTGISDPREFTSTDAGTIAWTLIDETQSESNGDLGITQGTIETSLNRTKSFERKNIAQAILELSETDFGFDFEITADKVFNVYYPFKGTTLNDVVFRYPGNCHNMESFENGWDVINHVLGLGKHWGGEEIQYVGDDATSQSNYGRRETIESYKDIEILAFLTDMVDEDIAYNKDINKVVKFSSFVDDKTEPYKYELGDAVRVVADDLGLNESLYVYERKFQIDDNDEVTVDLTLGD